MKVLVCGGRDYDDWEYIEHTLNQFDIEVLIHGGARGADQHAAQWAKNHGVAILEFPADWKSFGRAAGVIRNRQMLTMTEPDLVVAFPGGKGTNNMVTQAKKAGVPVDDRRSGL